MVGAGKEKEVEKIDLSTIKAAKKVLSKKVAKRDCACKKWCQCKDNIIQYFVARFGTQEYTFLVFKTLLLDCIYGVENQTNFIFILVKYCKEFNYLNKSIAQLSRLAKQIKP